MGINMTVELFYGVKIEGSENCDIILKNFEDECISEHCNRHLGYLSDCYENEWVVIGKRLQQSQDNRYDSPNFFWECPVSEEDKHEVHEYLNRKNIEGLPKLYCFTYYS